MKGKEKMNHREYHKIRRYISFLYMKYLKAFVIGSCAFWYLPQFISVHDFTRPSVIHHKNPEKMYYEYTIYHPIRVGLINVLSLMMKEYLNLTNRTRF